MKPPDRPALHPGKEPAGPTVSAPSADRLLQEALALHRAGQFPQAEALYRRILEIAPNQFDALHLLGLMANQFGKNEVAIELIDRAIEVNPSSAEAHSNRGSALHALERFRAALEDYDKAILLKPDYAEAYSNRGNTLCALERFQAAVESCDRAIALKPDLAEAHNNRASALHALQQDQAALESCEMTARLQPDNARAQVSRANLLYILQRYQEAVACYDKAIQINPQFAEAYSNRASALRGLRQFDAALASCARAIQIDPGFAEAYANRGSMLLELRNYREALESFDKALLLKPGFEYLRGQRLQIKRAICDWEGTEDELRHIEERVHRGERAAYSFTILAVTDSPALHRKAAEIYARDKCSPRPGSTPAPPRPRREKIRVGYFSNDFYNHATSYLMAELFELHDRSRFEVFGFSFSPDTKDEMQNRVSAAMDRFVDVRSISDRGVAQLSRVLEVDIAVDLKGFTLDCRAGIFAERAAPIQVNYLGYPGTTGADCMDYLIADHTLIPEDAQRHYSEKIVYLPDCYQVNDSRRRPIPAKASTRPGEGLPESGFVFCCFNNSFKFSPDTFDIWMRILRQVGGSVLWLLEDNSSASANLRKEAESRGVSANRLIFAGRLPLAEHLARHRLADLFLDTLPYNAHTTASDALWAGLPVLTCMGEAFAGRVAASLLRAINLPELVTGTPAAYQQLAIDLALNPERLQQIREKLQRNRLTTPLFDTAAFTRQLEAAYIAMVERYQAGLPPEHISIPNSPSQHGQLSE